MTNKVDIVLHDNDFSICFNIQKSCGTSFIESSTTFYFIVLTGFVVTFEASLSSHIKSVDSIV